MSKFSVTKIFLGMLLVVMVSHGVLAASDKSCFVCVPKYTGSTTAVQSKANNVATDIRKAKSDADGCNMFVAHGMDNLNRANPDLKQSGCNRCLKVVFKNGDDEFIGRGCETNNAPHAWIATNSALDDNLKVYYCDGDNYCNAAPSQFNGSLISMVISSALALSFKKFM